MKDRSVTQDHEGPPYFPCLQGENGAGESPVSCRASTALAATGGWRADLHSAQATPVQAKESRGPIPGGLGGIWPGGEVLGSGQLDPGPPTHSGLPSGASGPTLEGIAEDQGGQRPAQGSRHLESTGGTPELCTSRKSVRSSRHPLPSSHPVER